MPNGYTMGHCLIGDACYEEDIVIHVDLHIVLARILALQRNLLNETPNESLVVMVYKMTTRMVLTYLLKEAVWRVIGRWRRRRRRTRIKRKRRRRRRRSRQGKEKKEEEEEENKKNEKKEKEKEQEGEEEEEEEENKKNGNKEKRRRGEGG
ncbi:hypothetical protein H5410_002254 [Solanum commersonii]|uniref:Uncharacterized protein n=1 Tax=Solanum commersonii TaxID=4109 RepID=A0A9J6B1G2_SOLCO|nr:hypothetical protein H5410_002254 [Solanum commersonii]